MKRRDSNMELLRICAMLMIAFVHVLGLTGLLDAVQPSSKKYWLLWWLEGLGCVSTNLFVLLGGYYLCSSRVTPKKVLRLVSQVWFYSVICYIAAMLLNQTSLCWDTLRPVLFPVVNSQYWFITAYLGLMLLTPLLNRAINAMDRKAHFSVMITLVFLFSVIPSVCRRVNFLNVGEGYCLDWFLCLYVIGAYLRRYPVSRGGRKSALLTWLLGAMVYPLSRGVVLLLVHHQAAELSDIDWLCMRNSIFALTASLGLFHFFLRLRVPEGGRAEQWIGRVSPLVFGVYLFHVNPSLYHLLWQRLIHPASLTDSLLLWPYLVAVTLLVFGSGLAVEAIRQRLFRGAGKGRLSAAMDRLELLPHLYRFLVDVEDTKRADAPEGDSEIKN